MLVPAHLLALWLFGSFLVSGTTTNRDHNRAEKLNPDLSDTPHESFGHHNSEYDRDAFLGPDARRFDDMTPEETHKNLEIIVDKIDTDKNGLITPEELKAWIKSVSTLMLDKEVDRIWETHNLASSDHLTWDKHANDLIGEDGEYEGEDEETQNAMLAKDKRRWDVADSDKDGKLTKKEAFSFLYPEHDVKMRDILIQETVEEMDKNGDGNIDLEEFIKDMWSPSSAVEKEPDWVATERADFTEKRDLNKDGKLDAEEIAKWIFPEDYDHVDAEVKHLFSESDVDSDGMLSKEEILDRADLFVGSQVTNFGELLGAHDEL